MHEATARFLVHLILIIILGFALGRIFAPQIHQIKLRLVAWQKIRRNRKQVDRESPRDP